MAGKSTGKKSGINRSGIAGKVRALIEKTVTDAGYCLWDVEYVKEGTEFDLVVTIDKDPFVTIDDCENVTRLINPILDEADPVPDSYYLEVFSAGAERDLKYPAHFNKFLGKRVKLGFFTGLSPEDAGEITSLCGSKSAEGTLTAYDDTSVTVRPGEDTAGPELRIELKKCSYIRSVFDGSEIEPDGDDGSGNGGNENDQNEDDQ